MQEVASNAELAELLRAYIGCGGVLDYVLLETAANEPAEDLHRAAALSGIAAIDRRLEQWALEHASAKYPIEMFFRLQWDESQLAGERISFATFSGTDDVEPKPLGNGAEAIPNVDGYKTAFFHPPYGLQGSDREQAELFAGINRHVFGEHPGQAEIVSWSTSWSNYFDAGHEWWGAFYWTMRSADPKRLTVIGASTTD